MASRMVLTKGERQKLVALSQIVRGLHSCLQKRAPAGSASAQSWFRYLAAIKKAQGNMHMQLSFLACLMAKAYLASRHSVEGFDVAAKAQGAPGVRASSAKTSYKASTHAPCSRPSWKKSF